MKKREEQKNNLEAKLEKKDKIALVRKVLEERTKKIRTKRIAVASTVIAIILIVFIALFLNSKETTISTVGISQELHRAMQYDQFEEGDELLEATENVKFSAFFLRDLDGDGYAEKIKGTCKDIGGEDTLYMELNVLSEGYLKDGKITIDGQNFYLQTALPKDEELAQNFVGNNTKEILFNSITNGTQKLLTGKVRSGDYTYEDDKFDALKQNINNYSREDNKIILTGIYVAADGTEIEIVKEVPLTVDWYGTAKAEVFDRYNTYTNLSERINEEEQTIELAVKLYSRELDKDLILTKNRFEGTIPALNGYMPTEVSLATNYGTLEYNSETGEFVVERVTEISEDGTSTVMNTNYYYATGMNYHHYELKIKYPLNAYLEMGTNSIRLSIPVKVYYEGANNSNDEFLNPYKSNVVLYTYSPYFYDYIKNTYFDVDVGKYTSSPTYRYFISKQKALRVYNGFSEGDEEDSFVVSWEAYIGTDVEEGSGIIMSESKLGELNDGDLFEKRDNSKVSADAVTNFVGFYVYNATSALGNDGWIKVYDNETGNLLVTFTKKEWETYNSSKYYMFEVPVKHIRIETSAVAAESNLYVYNLKQIDDVLMTETISKEEFDNILRIRSYLKGYLGESLKTNTNHSADYEEPYAIAKARFVNNTLSTQTTVENVVIEIEAQKYEYSNTAGWIDGEYLIKIPDEILLVEINEVKVDVNNVEIVATEVIENENGRFIKVITNNIEDVEEGYRIRINANITPDPRIETVTKNVDLYAYNNDAMKYYYEAQDIYDVNNNLNTSELVNKTTSTVQLVSPNSLLTNQIASEYDDKNSIVISPQEVDITPVYAKVDNEKRTAKISIQMKNNYSSAISDVVILGKIPFEGNTTVLSKNNLNSQYTTKMIEGGITIPDTLKGKVTVYYSTEEDPDKNLTNESNKWVVSGDVANWEDVKSFLIVFENYDIGQREEHVFSYKVEIPNGLLFNQIAYSHHGIYFSLNTVEGKYRTQTESNKLGFRIAEKFNVEILKTQLGRENVVPGATYALHDFSTGTIKSGTTDDNGSVLLKNIYAERIYELSELKSPDNYTLNTDKILFTTHVDENGMLSVETIENEQNAKFEVIKNEGEQYKIAVNTQDEAKANLVVNKIDLGTNTALVGVKFKLSEVNGSYSKISTTSAQGELTFNGIEVGKEYELSELKSKDYYLIKPIKFRFKNIENAYIIEILSGKVENQYVDEIEHMPYGYLTIGGEKIPTYSLEINKIEKITEVEVASNEENSVVENEVKYLAGAKFRLFKDAEVIGTYYTDENGKFTINDLYQYVAGKSEPAEYILKELAAPEGYAKAKDIKFMVQLVDGSLSFINLNGKESKYSSTENTVNLFVENSPSFKLVKKDAETGEVLEGVKFAIYNVDGEIIPAKNSKGETLGTLENIDGRDYYVLITDINGTITADLPEGLYKAIEVQTHEQYVLDKTEHYFGVGATSESLNKKGVVEWGKLVKADDDVSAVSHIITEDNDIIIPTSYYGNSLMLDDIVVKETNENHASVNLRIDDKGNYKDIQIVNENINYTVISGNETLDGGYITSGYVSYTGEVDLGNGIILPDIGYEQRGLILKYNSSDELVWAKVVNCSEIISAEETSDGGIIAAGSIDYSETGHNITNDISVNNIGNRDVLIVKYNANGDVEWANVVGDEKSNDVTAIAITKDNGVVVILSNYDMTSDTNDYWALKCNSNGEIVWEEKNNYDPVNVQPTSDGGFVLISAFIGGTELPDGKVTVTEDIISPLLIKYDSNCNIQNYNYSLAMEHACISVYSETMDGGYIVSGLMLEGAMYLGNGVAIGAIDCMSACFVAKYDSTGMCTWGEVIETDGLIIPTDISEIKENQFIVSGVLNATEVDLGNDRKLVNTIDEYGNAYESTFIISITEEDDVDVTIRNAKQLGGTVADCYGYSLPTSDKGYVLTALLSSEDVDIGNGIIVSNNNGNDDLDGLVIKYNQNDEIIWYKHFGTALDEQISGVVETNNGDILVLMTYSNYNNIEIGSSIEIADGVNVNIGSCNDVIIVRLSADGEIKNAISIIGEQDEYANYISMTNDNGFAVLADSYSEEIIIGDTIIEKDVNNYEYILLKFDENDELVWNKRYGSATMTGVTNVESGIVVGGEIYSEELDLGNGYTISDDGNAKTFAVKYDNNGNAIDFNYVDGDWNIQVLRGASDGGVYAVGDFIIFKMNSDLEEEWSQLYEGEVFAIDIVETQDGGCIIVGAYLAGIILDDNTISASSTYLDLIKDNPEGFDDIDSELDFVDGFLMKYDALGNCEWIHGSDVLGAEFYTGAIEKSDGSYLVSGLFTGERVEFSNGSIIENKAECTEENPFMPNGMLLNISLDSGISENQELVVENEIKQFLITTNIITGEDTGFISGNDLGIYEIVKYGHDSEKDIVITPAEDYEISEIIINNQVHEFVPEEDGSYTLPKFSNVTENKKIEVKFVKGSNKFTINKVDSVTKEMLANATFDINQIIDGIERLPEQFDNVVDNGTIGKLIEESKKVNAIGDINNAEYHFVLKDGVYVPTNSKTYELANGRSQGVQSTTANSYFEIDLSDKEGEYVVVVNASVNSESNYDYGYATIKTDTNIPTHTYTNGQFIKISGNITSQDYVSNVLSGGNIYYLHLGYRKDSSVDRNDDQFIVNSINVVLEEDYNSFEEFGYNFEKVDGKIISTNNGMPNTKASSYIKIDLSDYKGTHTLKINAEISSESNYDYGYAYISNSAENTPIDQVSDKIIYISGNKSARDYTYTLSGEQIYYLHLGYQKNGKDNSGTDTFTINNVSITLDPNFKYEKQITTNELGQIIAEIPYGKYEITEIQAPEGYVLNSEPIIFEFGENTEKEITIENERVPKLTVHHYEAILNEDGTYTYTTNKVAEDEIITGNIGDVYNTSVRLDLAKYELIKDEDGDYIFPDNMSGNLVSGDSEVNYYYAKKEIVMTVNHYIDGTENKVLLKDGTEVVSTILRGFEGENYTTEPISSEQLHEKFELIEIPYNANGTFGYETSTINYYYKVKSYSITAQANKVQEKDENGNTVEVEGGEVIFEKETVKYGENSKKDIIVKPYDTYEVSNVKVNGADLGYTVNEDGTVTLDKVENVTENKVITIEFVREKSNIIVHHYLIDTTEKVPAKEEGTVVEDQVVVGPIGSIYYTNESANISDEYMFAYCTDNATGVITKDVQEVIYYYKLKDYAYRIEYYLDGELHEELTDNRKGTLGKEITTYVEQKIDGYTFNRVENLPMIITKDETSNVIKAYYDIRNDLSYTVKYFFDGVEDESLRENFENQTYGTVIESVTNKCIDGYSESHTNLPLTIGTGDNIVEVFYTKNIGSYTIKYLKEDSKTFVKEPTVIYDRQLGEVITEYAPEIEGYDVINPEETITITEDYNEIIFYYRSEEVKYVVEYLDVRTNEPIYAERNVYGFMYGDVITEIALDIPGYVVQGDGILEFTITEMETKVTFYYEPRSDLSYTIEYYYNDVLNEEKTEKIINQTYLSEISTYIDKVEEGYELDKVENLPLIVTLDEDKNLIKVYYISNDIEYKVEYYYDGELNEEATVVKTGKYKEVVNTYEDKVIDGYVFEKVENIPLDLNVDETLNVIKVYYKANIVDYTVNYYFDGEINEEYTTVLTGIVGKEITEYPELDVEGYGVEKVENLPLILTDDSDKNIINVYYEKADSKIIVRYVDKLTNQEIELEKVIESKVLKEYDLNNAIKDVEGYVLVEKPEELKVVFTEEEQIFIFYYIQKAEVLVNYLEKDDTESDLDNVVIKEMVIDGYIGKEYEVKPEEFEYYVYEGSTDNTKGEMTAEPIEVSFYYTKVESGVCEKHIDVKSGEILDVETHSKLAGDDYNIEPKEFEGYDLYEEQLPDNASGVVGEETIEVRYYYIRKATVKVEYLDNITNEKIADDVVLNGHEGDEYLAEEKNIEDYIVVEDKRPINASGTMNVVKDEDGKVNTETVVKFYYVHKSKVVEKHINIMNNDILEEKVHEGYEGKEYEILSKEFENFDLVEESKPENAKGTMTKDEIEVTYYYVRKTKVKVEHINQETGEKIIDIIEIDEDNDGIIDRKDEIDPNVVIEGHEGDEYTTSAYNFRKYKVVDSKLPENASGRMNVVIDEDGNVNEETVVRYYYVARVEVVEKHIDIKTGKEIEEQVVHEGTEGDPYDIPSKEYEGYDLVEEKQPTNAEGTMSKDVVEVKYYYVRRTKVVVEYIDKETGEVVKETVEIRGHEGDEYLVEEQEIEGYKLVKEEYPENTKGTMDVTVNEDGTVVTTTYVRYYYEKVGQTDQPDLPDLPEEPKDPVEPEKPQEPEKPEEKPDVPTEPEEPKQPEQPQEPAKKKGKVIVKFLEKGTNKVLANEKVIEGNEGDEYTTKSVTIDKYTLDKEPANKKGTIKEGTTEVIYYYYLTKIPAKDEVTLKPVKPENKVESDDPFDGELPETGIGYASMIVMILIISIGVVNIVVICVRRFVNKNNK